MADDEGTKIPVRRLTQASDFAALDSATLLHFVVVSGSEAARALAAEFEAYLIERADTLTRPSDSERKASDEAALSFVRKLERLGCVVSVGVSQSELRFDDDPGKTRAWHVGCIAVSNISDEATVVAVKNT